MREGIGQSGQRFLSASENKYGELGSDETFSLLSFVAVTKLLAF